MQGYYFIIPSILIILLLFYYIRVIITVIFDTNSDNPVLRIEIISRFYTLQKTFLFSDLVSIWDRNRKKTKKNKKKIKLSIRDYIRLGNLFLKHLVMEKIDWKSSLGLGDAMLTALCTGSLWAFKGTLTGLLTSLARIEKINIAVDPDFSNKRMASNFNCILKMRIVHIILITLFFLVLIVRGYINGWTTGKKYSSYRRFNENRYASY